MHKLLIISTLLQLAISSTNLNQSVNATATATVPKQEC